MPQITPSLAEVRFVHLQQLPDPQRRERLYRTPMNIQQSVNKQCPSFNQSKSLKTQTWLPCPRTSLDKRPTNRPTRQKSRHPARTALVKRTPSFQWPCPAPFALQRPHHDHQISCSSLRISTAAHGAASRALCRPSLSLKDFVKMSTFKLGIIYSNESSSRSLAAVPQVLLQIKSSISSVNAKMLFKCTQMQTD